MESKKRDIAISIILSIVTCGIYSIVWFICLTDEVKKEADDTEFVSGPVAFLLTIVTCGIFEIYWAYKMGEFVKRIETKNGLEVKDNSIIYLILTIVGLGIVTQALIQNELNTAYTAREAK